MISSLARRSIIGFIALSLLAFGAYYVSAGTVSTPDPVSVEWLITHRPVELFDEPARVFAREFKARTGTVMDVHVTGPDDYDAENRRILGSQALEMLASGNMQVVTLNIKSLIETVPEVAVLMRPYLFSSYEEAEAVYDGAVGKKILDAITERTNARALAFTYSGGFMIVQSNTQSFTTASDFKNKRIATINGSTSGENISALGAEAVVLPIGDYSNKELNQMVGEYDGVETTYTRLTGATPRFITETNHSLLITAVLVDKTFFSSLSLSEQTALQEAATIAARAERQESRALAAKNKQALIDSGTRISTLSPSARDEFVRNTSYLYTKYPEETGLVETIRKNQ